MTEFVNTDLSGSRFERADLTHSVMNRVKLVDTRIRDADLSGLVLRDVNLSRAVIRAAWMNGVVMRGVELADVDIYGEIGKLVVNGVDVGDYVNAELDKRYPDRRKMRPEDRAGYLEAWDTLGRLWDETVERARRLDPAALHESVDGEWSFIETQRHLVYATDVWLRRAILGDPAPWHPLDLPWDEAPDSPGTPRDREARPTLDEILEVRRDRRNGVRAYLETLTPEIIASHTTPVDAPGWPDPIAYPTAECLKTILNEEWEHHLYATRDLAILETQK